MEHQNKVPLSLLVIQVKARSIHDDLNEEMPSDCEVKPFTASRGWFESFKRRYKFHNNKVTGEAAASDTVAAEKFSAVLANIIEEGRYSTKQVFNVDETGLYWKRMPTRTYMAKEEKTAPGFKPANDRLTLLLVGNTEGDYKLKTPVIYLSETPRALKGYAKEHLPVIWRPNPEIQAIFLKVD